MTISNVGLIIKKLIFLLFIIFDIVFKIIKDKRELNYLIFILINNINNREDILLIDKNYKINFAS